jgi:hypothetical protein
MSDTLFHRIEQSRFYDWTMRLPIVLYSFYALAHDVISFSAQVAQDPAMWAHADAGVIIATLARVSQWMFVALLAVLPLSRHRPIAKSTALLPRFAALITVCIPPFCVLLDRAPPNLWCNLLATLAGISASILGVLTLSFLGRSFSVMPEARRLVTTGPYSIVRHPLVPVRTARCGRHIAAGTLGAGGDVAGTHRGAADCARAGRKPCWTAPFRSSRPIANTSRS